MKFTWALITGASSGIGEALARLLASKGISLVLTGRNIDKLEELQRELSHEVPVEIIAIDLASNDERKQLVKVIQNRQVDLLINNAGFGLYGKAYNKHSKELLEMIEVDVSAVVHLTVETAKALVEKGKPGTIMNISSAAAFQAMPNLATYAAAKAFVNSFSESVDFELCKKGVRVLVACPGKVQTPFSNRASGGKVKSSQGPFVMTPDFAAQQIWKQIIRQKRFNIFHWPYKIGTLFSSIFPKSLVASFTSWFMKGKSEV